MVTRTSLVFGAFIACIAYASVATGTPNPEQSQTTTGMDFNCKIPPGFKAVESMADIPKDIIDLEKIGTDVSPLREKWNDSDVMDGSHNAGLEFAMHKDRRWIVGIGVGGIATSLHIEAFDLAADGSIHQLPSPSESDTPNFCDPIAGYRAGLRN